MSGKRGKNDAAASCEAITRPKMRCVPIKTVDQQGTLCVHRVRQGFIEERTATITRTALRIRHRAPAERQHRASAGGRGPEDLPGWAKRIGDLLSHLHALDLHIAEYDAHVKLNAQADERARRLMRTPGARPPPVPWSRPSAMPMTSTTGDSWLPGSACARQYSTGGKPRLGSITKAGEAYLRTLLIPWTHAPFWPTLPARPIALADGHSPCNSAPATARHWLPSPPRTRVWPGPCSAKARRSERWPEPLNIAPATLAQ